MGHSRPRPKYLAKKLLQIRHTLRVSQGELVRQLGVQALIDHTTISKYELDKNEPPLTILLAYARLIGIPVEQIIDDELELTIWFSQAQRSFPTHNSLPKHQTEVGRFFLDIADKGNFDCLSTSTANGAPGPVFDVCWEAL